MKDEGTQIAPADGTVRYEYDARRYLFDVKMPVILAALAIPVAGTLAANGILAPIMVGVIVLSLYILFNTLIAKTYPQTVELSATELSLTSFGRTDTYRVTDISRLQVRENGMTRSTYIRVNGGGLLRGRYFVGCGDLYDADGNKAEALFRFLLDTEARLDPDNLRVRARCAAARKEAAAAGSDRDASQAPASRRHNRKRR